MSENKAVGCIEKYNIDELTLVLNLFNAQLSLAIHKSDMSVGELTDGFTLMMDNMHEIKRLNVKSNTDNLLETQGDINKCCDAAETHINGSVVAFQFYDRLSQQIDHLTTSLNNVAILLNDGDQAKLDSEWKKLQSSIKSSYTTSEEEQMFTAVLAGKSIKDAIADIDMTVVEDDDDIDLF